MKKWQMDCEAFDINTISAATDESLLTVDSSKHLQHILPLVVARIRRHGNGRLVRISSQELCIQTLLAIWTQHFNAMDRYLETITG